MIRYKFRGISIDSGKWVFGDLFQGNLDTYIVIYHDKHKDFEYIKVHANTVGQYTGLKDKNRKELYPKDIIERWGDVFEIEDIFQVGYLVHECTLMDGDFKIVGNVHENPELLK